MMYKIFRKELSSRSAFDLKKPDFQQSQLIELISRMIKNIKKKQNLYNRMVCQTQKKNRQALDQDNLMVIQFQKLVAQMKQLEHSLNKFKNESFYASKNYLYTVFKRTIEIVQLSMQRCLTEGKKDTQTLFQNIKEQLKQIYLNESYQQKYQIMHIFNFMNKSQQTRILSFIKKPMLDPLYFKKQRIILQKLKDYPFEGLKKTQSIQLLKKKDFTLDEIIKKKINFELATEKRMKQRKDLKIRKNLFKIYEILQIKTLNLENCNAQNQEIVMLQRNASIKQSLKKWQKKYSSYKFGKSIIK